MKASHRRSSLFAFTVCVVLTGRANRSEAQTGDARADSSAVVAAAAQFHQALAKGDSASAVNLLAGDLVVLESGELERRADYVGHHLSADIAFAKAVTSTRLIQQISILGDAAWVVATSSTSGTFEGRAVRSEGAELMVLRRRDGVWRIVAIHWSSRRARTGHDSHH